MNFRYVFALIILILSFQSHAGRIINSVTLSPNPASVGDTISVSISVTGTGTGNATRWRSTSYSVNGASDVCVNTDNFRSTSLETDTFDISGIASTNGTYEIDFTAYRGNQCNDDDSDAYSTTLIVGSETPEITLSPDIIFDTDSSLNAVIGNLSINAGSGYSNSIVLHTYNGGTDSGSCAAGAPDNWRFSISNNILSIGNASGSTIPIGEYTICVKTNDSKFRQNVVVYVEENPAGVTTEINLSNDTIYNYVAYAGTEIGGLTVTDPKSSSSVALHTHDGNTLAGSCAAGATDNSRFGITNNILSIVNDNTTALEPGEYTICVKTTDDYFRQNLTIYVEEPDEYPTFFTLSNTVMQLSNTLPDAEVGELISADEDINYTFAVHYSNEDVNVGECVGDFSDNQYFYVSGNTLHLQSWINNTFEAREYTICIKGETGNGIEYLQMFGISVSDDLTATFLDKFNTQSYNNNDGLLDWASDWQESNDDGDADSGDIEIENNRLHLVGSENLIYREVDLSSFTVASLTFDYEFNTSASDDDVHVLIRTDDNEDWTILHTFEGGNDEQGTLSPIDISDFISNDTEIGIYTVDGFDNNDDMYIDNFAINASGTATTTDHTYYDRFDSVSYSNNDGVLDWIGDWDEGNDDDDASDGDITIENGELKITDTEVSITREANLEGYTSAILSFSYHTITSHEDDIVYLQIRKDNDDWVTLQEFAGSSSSNASGDVSIDISSYIDEDVDVRFLTGPNFDRVDAFYVDDFAIDATIGGSCPSISDYDLIFHDDFSESVYQLNDTWSSEDFDRSSTSVWPNDTIYTLSSEELDIVFEIDNGTLQIAGDVTNLGNSEYGVLLHDVSSQGYSSSTIQEYSIETSISAYADEIGNNDVGVVFGYQGENDFYLLRWTKIGVGYVNDTTFPGSYRNLDLVWVKDGVPTVLASQEDFYSDDPLSVQITVNEDGISICINGNDVMSYTEAQPNMHSVGLFSYDNDYDSGLQIHDFKVYCRECEKDDDIIGWWPMEGNLDDLVGINDLFEVGDIQFGSSNIASTVGNNSTCQYAIMDGESYGQVDDSGELNGEELAVSAWVYPTSYPNDANDTNGNDTLMAISSKDENYEFHINSNGKLYWWWQNENSTERTLTSTSTIPLNTWSHVAISYKAGEQEMYINGILERSSSWNEIPKQSSCDYFVGADVSTPFFGGSCSVIPARTFIGELDEVRIYGRYLSESEIKADMEKLRECGLVGSEVHHYEIIHDTTGLTCLSETATVKACADESCSSLLNAQINGYFDVNGATDQSIAFDFNSGSQQITYNNSNAEIVTLSLSNVTPASQQTYTCTEANCQTTFSDSGYLVNLDDFESASGLQEVTVQAVKTDEISQTCVPDYVGNQPVNIDFSYKTPDATSVSTQQTLEYSATSNGNSSQINSGTGLNTNLTFSDTDASSSFYVDYDEVGELTLTVSDQNNVLIAGNADFAVYPSSLVIKMYADVSADIELIKYTAAKPFDLNIYAVNANGDVTKNYRPDTLQLASVMNSPTLAGGADTVQFNYNNTSSIISTDNLIWQDVNLTFTEHEYISEEAKFNNVGAFSLNIQEIDYFGHIISTANMSTAEFIPYYYDIEDITVGSIQDTMTGGAYIGQTLEFENEPTIRLIAKDFNHATAKNYQGDSFGGISLNDRTYSEQVGVTIFNGGDISSGIVTDSDNNNFNGSVIVTIENDTFKYIKESTPIEPFDSQITLNLSVADLTDSDGVGYCSGDNPTTCPNTFEPYSMEFTAQPELRYGRLRLENAFGPEDVNIRLDVTIEYYDGKVFVTNEKDSATNFFNYKGIIENVLGSETYEMVEKDGDAKKVDDTYTGIYSVFNSGTITSPQGLYIDAKNEVAVLKLQLDEVPEFLSFDWDGNNTLVPPSATVLFGRYRGNDRIIYKRER